MSTHEDILALIPGYPELAAHERRAIDEHAETCEQCAAALDRQRRLRNEIAHAPRLAPNPRAVEAVHAAIRQRASPWGTAPTGGSRLPALALVSTLALLLLAGGVLWLKGQARSNTAAIPSPAPQTAPATPPPSTTPAANAQDDEGFADAAAWLKQNAIPLTSAEPGTDMADLAALRDIAGGARIVVLDDSTYYGTHELQSMQQRILEYLVKELGFNNVLLDEPWTRVDPLNTYVRTGAGNLDALLPGLTGEGWQTAEMAYTFRWLNANAPAVRLRGFLPPEGGDTQAARDVVRAYLAVVDPNEAAPTDAMALAERMTAHPNRSVAPESVELYDRAAQAAGVLLQAEQLDRAAINQRRQLVIQFTVDNLLPAIDPAGPGEKFVIWTHGRAGGLQDPDGLLTLLRTHYGDQMRSIGFAFRQGALYARTADWTSAFELTVSAGRTLVQVAPALPGSYEDFFAQAGVARYLVDLRQLSTYFAQIRRNERVVPPNRWLGQQHLRWQSPGWYDECYPEDSFVQMQLPARLDAVIYFEQVSPAAPLSKLPEMQPAICLRGPENLDFKAGARSWPLYPASGEYRFRVEAAVSGSQPTAYLEWAGPEGNATIPQNAPASTGGIVQTFRADDYRGKRVRLSATLAVDSPSAVSYLGVQAFGPGFTSGVRASVQVEGAAPKHYELVIDVPGDATRVMLSVSLGSRGRVSVSDVRFEVVGQDVPLSPKAADGTLP